MTDREKAQAARETQQDKLAKELSQVPEVQEVASRARALLVKDSFVLDLERAFARRT
jgi:hypothetical protein